MFPKLDGCNGHHIHYQAWAPFRRHIARHNHPRFSCGAGMAYWRFDTSKGAFIIVERTTKGVELYFGENVVGQYPTPQDAAIAAGSGDHDTLPCAPEDGKSLGVPVAAREWRFVAV